MENKKNVLIMIPTLNVAGAEKFVVDLAINLDKSLFNVKVGIIYNGKQTYYFDLLKQNNIEIVDFSGKNKFHVLKNINKYFKNNKIDVLHTNLNSILYTMFFVKKYKIKKRLFTFHSTADRISNKLKKKIYKYAFNKLNFIPVAISNFIKDTVVKEFKLDPNKVECVYNGVNINNFKFVQKEFTEPIKLINVGTFYHIKNQQLLINGVKRLVDKGYNLKLTLVGDGKMREELTSLVKAFSLENYIEFTGIVPNVKDYLNNADIYCCSSLVEGLPIAVLEAMACGLPVITTNAGGIVDIVKDDYNGYVCANFEVEDYILLVEKLIVNKKLLLEMSKNSRLLAETLSIEECAKNYSKLYLK